MGSAKVWNIYVHKPHETGMWCSECSRATVCRSRVAALKDDGVTMLRPITYCVACKTSVKA